MNASLYVSIILALIGIGGTGYTAWKANNTTLERTNFENAKDIYAEYKQLNEDLKSEIRKNDERSLLVDQQLRDLQGQIREMEKQFKIREQFLEHEIELRDIRIATLEVENNTLRTELITYRT